MNYINDKGEWTGFDVDLGSANRWKIRSKIERYWWQQNKDSLSANRSIDISLANISQTRSREDQMDYAEPPYFWTGKSLCKKGKDQINKRPRREEDRSWPGSNAFTAAPQEIAKYTDKKPEMLSFQNTQKVFCIKAGQDWRIFSGCPDHASVAGSLGASMRQVGGSIWSAGLYGIGVPENESDFRDK